MTSTLLWRYRALMMALSVGALAAWTRLMTLGFPRELVFDEVYYARDAFSLLTQGYEGVWEGENQDFAHGDSSGLTERAAYVVHPPLGKWMIAAGMRVVGTDSTGWRFSGALVGVLTVVMIALIARRLLNSTAWGGVAGVMLALDGQHIVMSRYALLDGFMVFFAVAAFGLLLMDRDNVRRRLERAAARDRARLKVAPDDALRGLGSRLGVRWWRVGAMVALGLSVSVKWSGLYFAAGLLVWSVVWDLIDRRRAGYRDWVLGSGARALVTAVGSVVTVVGTYAASWWHWFASDSSYKRDWAQHHPDQGVTWLPDSWRSLVEYHREMLGFHDGLDAEHPYASDAWGWIIQYRPTAFHFEDVDVEGADERWVTVITALGHPMIWWALPIILLVVLWRLVRHRDWSAMDVTVGFLVAWLPWALVFSHRTIFTFYTVAMAPWAVLMIVWAMKLAAQPPSASGRWTRGGTAAVIAYLGLFLIIAAFFMPLWTGQPITYDYWREHAIYRSWI